MNSADLEDDMKFEIDSFNREVITEPFNRTVLNEINEYHPRGLWSGTSWYGIFVLRVRE